MQAAGGVVRAPAFAALCKEYANPDLAFPNLRALLRELRNDAPFLRKYFETQFPKPPSKTDIAAKIKQHLAAVAAAQTLG